jgi:hypothetical protein
VERVAQPVELKVKGIGGSGFKSSQEENNIIL